MLTHRTIALTCLGLALSSSLGCFGGGGSGDGTGAGSKNLTPNASVGDLAPSDLSVLCTRNASKLQNLNSAQTQCTISAVLKAKDETACETMRDACIEDAKGDAVKKCQTPKGKIECDQTVAELEDCLSKEVTWASSLDCTMAGTPPEVPACAKELEQKCAASDDLFSDKAPVGGGGGGAADGGDIPNDFDGSVGPGPEFDAGGSNGGACDDYDLGISSACNDCAVESCCDTYAECRADDYCSCFWDCANQAGADTAVCAEDCEVPIEDLVQTDTGFIFHTLYFDHAQCLGSGCSVECEF